MTPKVIAFVFAGRRQNLDLQLPLMRRILADNPNVELHVWNFTQCAADNRYVRAIEGERITVINDFYTEELPWRYFQNAYRHYAGKQYADRLFVKLDDDIVFIETERFPDFIEAVDANRGAIVSAKVVNNGASTYTEPGLREAFETLSIPLLDVHLSAAYGDKVHKFFFDHWRDMIHQPLKLIPTDDWMSINMIGFDWATCRRMAYLLGRPRAPETIAGRVYEENYRLGDEGAVNLGPRFILQGFTACHLYFGPQRRAKPDKYWARLRGQYADIGRQYLSGVCVG